MAEVFPDVVCTACSCVCDDLTLHVEQGRITAAQRACPLGSRWLLQQHSAPADHTTIDGQPAAYQAALQRAVELLQSSRAPLVYGLSTSSTPGQRAACALADRLGATLDIAGDSCHAAATLAYQTVGASTATLGEIRHHADLLVYWGVDPLTSHPRHLERCVDTPGTQTPRGRKDRFLVVIDVRQTATAEQADLFLQVEPGSDAEILGALRAALAGLPIESAAVGGIPGDQIRTLAQRLQAARSSAFCFGTGLTRHKLSHTRVIALYQLVRELNQTTRSVVQPLGTPSNFTGAEQVLCWQTGFPSSISFANGSPRYSPDEYSANRLLEQREVDAVVLVGSNLAALSPRALAQLQTLPVIGLTAPETRLPWEPRVQFTTAIDGIHQPGTAYRMDGVPIPLRALLPCSLPSDAQVLTTLCERLAVAARGT